MQSLRCEKRGTSRSCNRLMPARQIEHDPRMRHRRTSRSAPHQGGNREAAICTERKERSLRGPAKGRPIERALRPYSVPRNRSRRCRSREATPSQTAFAGPRCMSPVKPAPMRTGP